jgi:hypothetical protein
LESEKEKGTTIIICSSFIVLRLVCYIFLSTRSIVVLYFLHVIYLVLLSSFVFSGASAVAGEFSTQTLMQVGHIKVNGDYSFTRFAGELPGQTVFKSAWELDNGEWRPRIIKMAGQDEQWQTLNLRQYYPGNNLVAHNLVDASLWGTSCGPHHAGIILPRYAGILSEFTTSFTPSPELVLKHLDQIAVAVAAIHRINVVHCDLKPSNVFLDAACNAFLGDFGSMSPTGEKVNSCTMGYCIAEFMANRMPAQPMMDWAALVITGLQLVRKIVVTEQPVALPVLNKCIDGLRGDTEPVLARIVFLFDTYVKSDKSDV